MNEKLEEVIEKLENLKFKSKTFPEFMREHEEDVFFYQEDDVLKYEIWKQIGFEYNLKIDEILKILRTI